MGVDHRTPTLTVSDPRRLAVRSVGYCRSLEGSAALPRINRSLFDVAGRAVKQWDPRLWTLQQTDESAPASLSAIHSLSGTLLHTDSVDAGIQIGLPGLAAESLLGWDARGTQQETLYDDLLRPVAVFEQGASQPRRCTERMTYGYPGQDNQDLNLYGQLIRHDDPAGTLLLVSFALAGENLVQDRRFILDAAPADWPELDADREFLLEPGDGAVSTWRVGPLGDVLEQVDARGNRQRQSLTLDGRLFGSQLQLAGQGDWQALVSDIRYDAFGQIEQEASGNGLRTTLTYSPEDGRLIQRHAVRVDQVLQHLLYDYDPMGNVLNIEDQAQPVRYFANQRIDPISRFTYDSLYQLIEATGWEAGAANQGPDSLGRSDPAAVSNFRQTYRYDEAGNLLELTHVGAQSHGREIQAARYSNRCLSYRNGVPPTEDEIAAAFDARGNCLELDAGRFLAWDLRNQLRSVTPIERGSGLNDSEAYVYDGGGQRARKLRTLQTGTRTLAAEVRYLPGLELRADSGTGEALQVIIAHGGLSEVRVLHWESTPPTGKNDCYRYSVADHLGSVSLELAEDGQIISREHFYPFGETAYLEGEDAIEVGYKTVRYSGKERDATGLYYYGFRYYAPWLQRWINPDPAGAVDGLNAYRMVRNNPVTLFDNDGLMPVKAQQHDKGGGAETQEQSAVSQLRKRFEPRRIVSSPPATSLSTEEKGKSDGTSILSKKSAFGLLKRVDELKAPEAENKIPVKKTLAGGTRDEGGVLSTKDVSMSFKTVTTTRNRAEVTVQRLVLVFHGKFDLVQGKNLPEWPQGYELLPSQDWVNESGIENYENFYALEGAEREHAIALVKTKDPAALEIDFKTLTFAYDSKAKIITLKDGHHRLIAAARSGRTIELDSSLVPTSNLKWKDVKFRKQKPLKF